MISYRCLNLLFNEKEKSQTKARKNMALWSKNYYQAIIMKCVRRGKGSSLSLRVQLFFVGSRRNLRPHPARQQ
jgi:hypothetical protein